MKNQYPKNPNFFHTLSIANPKMLFLKICIIFLPTYLVAYFIDNMVYVLPTLASALIVGNGLDKQNADDTNENDGETTD